MTQNEAILKHLQAGLSLTPLSALDLCGTLRLSERIRELEKQGHLIDHEMVKVGAKRVCQYSWIPGRMVSKPIPKDAQMSISL